ncbi:hypothetical protein ABPG74_004624 [Tetrahymena malaccensis]
MSNLDKNYDILFKKISQFITYSQKKLQSQQIQNEDISPFITQSTCSDIQIKKLERYINQNKKYFQANSFSLIRIYSHLLGQSHLFGFIVRLIGDGMTALGIFIIDLITEELKNYNYQNQKQLIFIVLLMLGLVLNFTIRNQLTCLSDWLSSKQQAQMKSTLQYLIYKKSLLVKDFTQIIQTNGQNLSKNDQKSQSEEDSVDSSSVESPNINNLLTSDTEDQALMFERFSSLGVNFTMLVAAACLIYYKIGSSILGGSSLFIFIICFNFIANYLVKICLEKMYTAKDQRISLSKDVIEGIKSIKFLGWEDIFLKKINEIRKKEFKYLQLAKICEQTLSVMFSSVSCFLSYTFITIFVSNGNKLQDSNVFTIIATFSYFTFTLTAVPESIQSILKCFISYRRIQSYLNLKEIDQNYQIEDDGNKQILLNEVAISIKNKKFIWPSNSIQRQSKNPILNQKTQEDFENEDQFQLCAENIEIKKGSLNFVIGKIGSGKTAFLLSILREMEQKQDKGQIKSNGEFFVNGTLAYVAQNHWLQSKTIKENILYGEEYNQELYSRCIELCELKFDFGQFSKGHLKVLSSEGSNLSGGQKQRIALCRSLYANKDIYILDDIFSSLDAHVAERIFQNVVVNYLIKEKQKTVILATSHYSYLLSQQTSNIIYIQNGVIVNDKNVQKKYIQDSLQQQIEHDLQTSQPQTFSQIPDSNQNHEKISENSKQNTKVKKQSIQEMSSEVELLDKNKERVISTKQDILNSEHDENEEENQEEFRVQGKIKIKTYLDFFQSMTLFLVVIQALLFFMVQGACTLIDYWLKNQIDQNENQNTVLLLINQQFREFESGYLFLISLQLMIALLSYITFIITSSLSSSRIYNKLIYCIINSKMPFFDKNPIGRILNRLSDDINSIDESLQKQYMYCLEQVAYIIGYVSGICIQYPWMIFFFTVVFVLAVVFSNTYRPISREVTRLDTINQGALLNHINESCKGFSTIRAFGKQDYMIDQYLEKLRNNINSYVISLSLHSWVYSRSLLLANGIQLIIALTGIALIILDPSINKDIIVLTLQYSILFSSSVAETAVAFNQFEIEIISFERVKQFFCNDLEKVNEQPKQKPQDIQQKDNSIEISFDNISLSYEAQSEESLNNQNIQYALKDFSMQIKKGEKVAFCGRTGSGKTSIFNCLYRLYSIQNGNIFIQGQNIQSLSLKLLRDKISIIPQFGFLFNASLRDNLDPLQIHSKEKISNISKTYELSLDSRNNASLDLDFEIEESGKNLSNGQKQILNFLRVAINNRELICLDEATSNMDPKTNTLISDKIFELSQGKTLLVITHRLENIEKYDRIIVMDCGQIVESGSYQQLVKIKGGFFNKLKQNKEL